MLTILQRLLTAYVKDLAMKNKIVNDLERSPNDDQIDLYVDAWRLCPYVGHRQRQNEGTDARETVKNVLLGMACGEHSIPVYRVLQNLSSH